jgi:carbonic anhydrase
LIKKLRLKNQLLKHLLMEKFRLKYFFLLLTLLTTIKSIQNDDWDYKNHGTDWAATFSNCGKGQQAPGKILSSQAENLEKSNFFYANLNVKKGRVKNSTLELIENNNILSLSFKDLGDVIYNIKDPWSSKNKNNSKKVENNLKYDEEELQEAECHNIMIKIPGEHTYNNLNYIGELQVNCTFKKERSTESRGVYISIPIQINENNESGFSKKLKSVIVDGNINKDKLPVNIEFDIIDIIDGLAMMDGVFYYEGQSNYPPCDVYSMWFFVNKAVNFSQKVIDQLNSCIDKDKCPEGNNRNSFDIRDLYLYPQ